MTKINHNQLGQLIQKSYETKQPLFISGTTGIGKSETVRTIAKNIAKEQKLEFGEDTDKDGVFGFVDVRISQFEPADLRGLPDLSGGETVWLPPNWLPKNPNSKGIIFFDELNLAPPSIQSSAYQIILDRRLGDYKLPDGWVIISAGNRLEDRANVFELPAPLKNRFIHSELKVPTHEEWIDWAVENKVDGRIISFMNFKPQLLFKFDKNTKDMAFPTPRSWHFLSNLLKGEDDEETVELYSSSAVGEGTALEFVAFTKLQKAVDIDDLLANPKKFEAIDDRGLQLSLLGAISEKYRAEIERKGGNPQNQLEKTLGICQFTPPDFAILLIRLIKKLDKDCVKRMLKTKSWTVLRKDYEKYIDYDE